MAPLELKVMEPVPVVMAEMLESEAVTAQFHWLAAAFVNVMVSVWAAPTESRTEKVLV